MPASNLARLALLCASVTAALAAPSTQTRDDSIDNFTAKWIALLSKDSDTSPDAVLAVEYEEYSSSQFVLNNYCKQRTEATPPLPWSAAFYSGLDAYKAADARTAWTWTADAEVIDEDSIALQGSISLDSAGTSISALAFLETTVDDGIRKLSTLHWEFDATQAQVVLVQAQQCNIARTPGKIGIIV